MASAEIKRHWYKVAELGCIVSRNPECEIHHCHSGSMSDYGIHKTLSKKGSDWLVIPLSAELHRGSNGVHGGVQSFESFNGSQIYLLNRVGSLLDIDLFEKAGYYYDKSNKRYERIDAF